jgi:hypothetical protein
MVRLAPAFTKKITNTCPIGCRISGRSTFAVVVWLAAWGIVHARWQGRAVAGGRVFGWTLALIAIAAVAMFPPVWSLL